MFTCPLFQMGLLVPDGTILAELCVNPSLLQQIQEAQIRDEKLITIMGSVKEG